MATQQLLLPPSANRLTNPGFEWNQRGLSSYPTTGTLTLDGWRYFADLGSGSVAQIDSTIGSKGKSGNLTYTHVAGGQVHLYQMLERPTEYRGRTLTFAATIKASVGSMAALYLYDGTTQLFSPFAPAGVAVRYAVTLEFGAAALYAQVGLRSNGASGTCEMNDATLVLGDQPADYVPLHSGDDLERCQRYFERQGDGGQGLLTQMYVVATQQSGDWHAWNTTKGAIPTVTKVGTWAKPGHVNQPTMEYPDLTGYMLRAVMIDTGTMYFHVMDYPNACVTGECNP